VAVGSGQIEGVDLLERLDGGYRGIVEGELLLEGVQRYAFEQVSKGEVQVLGEPLQDFKQPPLKPNPGLNPVNSYHGTKVHLLPARRQVPWLKSSLSAWHDGPKGTAGRGGNAARWQSAHGR
jgi:hypothetical protein